MKLLKNADLRLQRPFRIANADADDSFVERLHQKRGKVDERDASQFLRLRDHFPDRIAARDVRPFADPNEGRRRRKRPFSGPELGIRPFLLGSVVSGDEIPLFRGANRHFPGPRSDDRDHRSLGDARHRAGRIRNAPLP